MYKRELEIDAVRCFRSILKRKGFILIITGLLFLIGLGQTLDPGVDRYESVATVYAAGEGSYTDSVSAVTAMNAYLDVANSYKVCQRAALIMGRSDIDADDVKNSIYVNSSSRASSSSSAVNFMNSSATIISFYSSSNDPDLAMQIADAMAQSYAIEMNAILNLDAVKVLDTAYTANLSYNATREAWKTRIEYAFVGFVLACIIVVASEIFDSKVRTLREATIGDKIPVIGIIPDNNK